MELRHYLSVVRKWLWLIILGAVLGTSGAYFISIFSLPVYQSTTTLLINQGADPIGDPYGAILTSQRIATTYAEQIKSSAILSDVIRVLNLPFNPTELRAMMTVQVVQDTQLIRIAVEDTNPERAQAVANQIAQVFIEQNSVKQQARFQAAQKDLDQQVADVRKKIDDTQKALAPLGDPSDPKNLSAPEFVRTERARLQMELTTYQTQYTILLQSAQDFRLAAARYVDTLTVLSPAEVPQVPIRPQTALNTLLGLVAGIILGGSAAFLFEYLDDTVKSPEDVTRTLELNTLGTIAQFNHVRKLQDGMVTVKDARSPYAEAYRRLRTNLQFSSLANPSAGVVVTSADPGEGKSTTLANLGIAIAMSGKKVILVDSDLRRPALHKLFGLPQEPGLTDALLKEDGDLDGILHETDVPGLGVLTSGINPPNPAELLGSDKMAELIEVLKQRADLVLFDAPPVLAVTDAILLAAKISSVLWVISAGHARVDALRRTREALSQVNAKILGAVLNRVSLTHGNGYGYYYYHYSDDGQKQKRRRNSEIPRPLTAPETTRAVQAEPPPKPPPTETDLSKAKVG